jgi:hypothetical protein
MGTEVAFINAAKDGGALLVLLLFLVWFARGYLRSVALIADRVNESTAAHLQASRETTEAMKNLTLAVMRMGDVIVKCEGQTHERYRNPQPSGDQKEGNPRKPK